MNLQKPNPKSVLHKPAPHESGPQHTTGEARYIDDLPTQEESLVSLIRNN